jgi:hypothetical protein
MTAPADFYQEVDPFESYDGLEFADEAKLPFMPGRRVFVPGGLTSATLNTPKGPAKLNLPAPVPTLAQFRSLEQALNSVTQRLNATNSQLLQVRREAATRKTDQSGMMSMLIPFIMQRKLRSDLDEHTHATDGAKPTFPTGGGKLDSLLPLLLLQPNLLGGAMGGATGGTPAGGSSDSISPLIQMMLIMEFIK